MTKTMINNEKVSTLKEMIQTSIENRKSEANKVTKKADKILAQLLTLDFYSPIELLQWVRAYQPYTEQNSVYVPVKEILELFAEYELYSGMCVGIQHANTLTKVEEAKWLIGQALRGLEIDGAMHPFLYARINRFLHELLSF